MLRKRGHGDRVERRALQVHQGAAGGVRIEDPGGRRGRALGARPHGHRGQRGGQVGVQAAAGGRRGGAAEVPEADALTGHDDRFAAERAVGDPGRSQPQHGQQRSRPARRRRARVVACARAGPSGSLVTSAASLLGPNRPAASTSGTKTPARPAIKVR